MKDSPNSEFLFKALIAARMAVEQALLENSRIAHTGVDYDHYVYLIVPKRQRRIWNMLEQFAADTTWLRADRDSGVVNIQPETSHGGVYSKNGEAAAARAAAFALESAGIEATVLERWR
jgi:glycine/D-amino acid oxidase-like deaminating enzyme